jgi:ElaB/YqjD/DUF883 family membrane-anchored ribosome-binding protein
METSTFSHRFAAAADECAAQHTMVNELKEAGEAAKRIAAENWESLRQSAGGYLQTGREKAREASAALQDKVRHDPGKALAIATVAGFALGFLLMRR